MMLQNRYPAWAISNFILLSLFGLLLRYMQVFGMPSGNYQFLLHAHSHFAFSGWMFFALAVLIVHSISHTPDLSFRNVFRFALISAYGMLISFTLYGYQALSICFSTLFIIVGYRFVYLVIKNGWMKNTINELGRRLIYASFFYLCISSIGPVALAPIAAAGLQSSPLYQDAIYFYLHFQMNGFMLLAALGLFAAAYLKGPIDKKIRIWLCIFILTVIPVFAIFTLWSRPPGWIYTLALGATLLHYLSWIRLCFYYRQQVRSFPLLVKFALAAISLKVVLQVMICVPAIGNWAFVNRDLIIAYVHLLTLGCVMPLILDQFSLKGFFVNKKGPGMLNNFFLITVVLYLSTLFLQPLLLLFAVLIPYYRLLLFLISLLFLSTGILYLFRLKGVRIFLKRASRELIFGSRPVRSLRRAK